MNRLLRSIPAWPLVPLGYALCCLFFLPRQQSQMLWVFLTFFLIVTGSSIGLFTDKRPYSFNRMFWLFVLVAFGLVPSYQVFTNSYPWELPLPVPLLLKANIVVLLGMGAYQLARLLTDSLTEGLPVHIRSRAGGGLLRSYRSSGMIVLLLLLVGYTALLGIRNVWLKGQIDIHWSDRVSNGVYLAVEKLVRGPVLYLMLLTIFLYRLRRIGRRMMIVVLVLCFYVNFPLALPRYLAATVCGAVLLSFGGKVWQERKQAFSWLLLCSWLLVYPVMGLSRWEAPKAWNLLQQGDAVLRQSFVSGDFDSYATLARTIGYVETQGHTGGQQLLTSSLFFVPRKYWPGKSVGSGALLYKSLGFRFTNMASPLFAEGYIDFGWIGTLLYACVVAVLAALYDRSYWHWRLRRAAEGDVSFLMLMYPACMILFFFLLRGDLLSALAGILGLCATAWLMHLLLRCKVVKL